MAIINYFLFTIIAYDKIIVLILIEFQIIPVFGQNVSGFSRVPGLTEKVGCISNVQQSQKPNSLLHCTKHQKNATV